MVVFSIYTTTCVVLHCFFSPKYEIVSDGISKRQCHGALLWRHDVALQKMTHKSQMFRIFQCVLNVGIGFRIENFVFYCYISYSLYTSKLKLGAYFTMVIFNVHCRVG